MIARFIVPVRSVKAGTDLVPVPAEGNAPSLAHLGQAALLGAEFYCSLLEVIGSI
jgi:hypothetical protein